ncbi:MAG: VCBS repeat-containing protein, partial [Candidatus Cloacimonetes bacterium]|nr:VCBS repeat-containing protein [Candidatus Cloacimonadota bacterium]
MKLVKISLLLIIFLFLFCCSYRIALLEITQEESEQIYNSWRESLEAAETDSIAYMITSEQIREECSGYAAFKKDRIALYLAFQGYNLLDSRQDSLKAEKSAKILRKKFPCSEETFKLARDEFYEKIYPIWSDDSLKVPVLKELLDKYPQTQWRRSIFQYLAYSLNQLGRISELQVMLKDFRVDFADDYLSHYLTAWYYEKNDLDLVEAEKFAEQAFELSQNYQVLDHYPGEEWNLERRAAGVNSGALLGRIMNRQKKYQETEELINGIITDNQLGVEDEATLASCYLQLAISCYEQGKEKQAIDSAIEALIAGDSRNKYTPEADSLLQTILSETIYTGDKTIQFIRERRKYNNVEFTDITIEAGLNGIHASRIAWGDYDNDGYQDLLLNGCRLFQNVSGEHFREVTALVLQESFQSRGGLWADFDNDGDLDILTTDPEMLLLQDSG